MTDNEKETLNLNAEEATSEAKESAVSAEETDRLGKFKDANSLLKAYDSLQSEFTKRCQKIKELEKRISEYDKDASPSSESAAQPPAGITEEEKREFLKGYLKQVIGARSKAILLDGEGAGLKTPNAKPRTVAEAGRLAKEILNKQ
ncbi:MAG: hypothetical protein J6W87_02110 [Clostridia bacterium]|nr:hypothetical protein [Clostridia bacterium]